MNSLSLDLETFSSYDLITCGIYRYTEAPDFQILIFAFSIDEGEVQVVDIAMGEKVPEEILNALTDLTIKKTSWNCSFEINCIRAHFKLPLDASQWYDTMIVAANLGLPMGLDSCSKALNIDATKDQAGKGLIRYFSIPCKPTVINKGRTRNMPEDAPDKWQRYKDYCAQDVRVEMGINKKLSFFKTTETERRLWALDQKINDTGILIDPQLVNNAIKIDKEFQAKLTEEAIKLTGLDNPRSVSQLKEWLTEEGVQVDKLTKDTVPELIKNSVNGSITRVLEIRQLTAKTSIKKYEAMRQVACKDKRARGLLQFYGASKTGRWSGRLIQVQNLPQNKINDLNLARNIVLSGDCDTIELLYGDVPGVLSQLIRTAFIPKSGFHFVVSDFSSIEARVIAWYADEAWRLEVFATHGKIYEASASQMFRLPLERITKEIRAKGKIAELALGFGGGVNALLKMGAVKMGLTEEELPEIVNLWRKANPGIVKLWKKIEQAALTCVRERRTIKLIKGLEFSMEKGILFITLPSGRKLTYFKPVIQPGKFGGESLGFMGVSQTTKQWGRIDTYGGSLVENIVQATARDILGEAMLKIGDIGDVVLHVHDEIVVECGNEQGLGLIENIMSTEVGWAPGLVLRAEAEKLEYYKK
jgi:DNA polymerase bacteriophage-type